MWTLGQTDIRKRKKEINIEREREREREKEKEAHQIEESTALYLYRYEEHYTRGNACPLARTSSESIFYSFIP